MTFPAFTFAFIIATLSGALFHMIVGGDARRLALYLLTAWVGFGVGQILGSVLHSQVLNIGTLNLAIALLTCWCSLIAVWLVLRRRRLFA